MHQYRETQTHYLILLWFVREVAQAVGGEVSMGSSWATCKNKKVKDTVRTREAGRNRRASNETFMDRGES